MEVLVIGAGVVGLAAARALVLSGHDVVVGEATGAIGSGISSRSSEVIHAGLYYPPGSARARHCVAGARLLYRFCDSHGVAHRRCGKLIVATAQGEFAQLERLQRQGWANGVEGLDFLDSTAARSLEPALSCEAALLSSTTGIVDSHALMLALVGQFEDLGGAIARDTHITRLERRGSGWVAHVGDAGRDAIRFDAVVNAAGLGAQKVARATEGFPPQRIPRQVLAKGSYFGVAGPSPFRRLIYPAPVDGGLGIHGTLDLGGRLRFGPDVEWVEVEDYAVDPARAGLFATAIRRYWPTLRDEDLIPDYAGIRPKLTGPGEQAADFIIDAPADHGLPGLVHLFGIESPGLTASLSLAEAVVDAFEG